MLKISLAAAAILASSGFAWGQGTAGAELGLLSCRSDGATGFIIGSSENLVCAFTPANDGTPAEVYAGRLDTFGLDIGITGETALSWLVLSAGAGALAPNALAGTYAGASVDASVGVGGGANILVGGSQNAITLQPVSLQTQEGINAAVGVSRFTLTPARVVAQ